VLAVLSSLLLLLRKFDQLMLDRTSDTPLSLSAGQPFDFTGPTVHIGFAPSFTGRCHRGKRFADAASRVIELAELGMSVRQDR